MLYGRSFGRGLTDFGSSEIMEKNLVVGKVSLLPSNAILKKIYKTDEKEYSASQFGTGVDTFSDNLRHIFRHFTRYVFRFFPGIIADIR